ncbi:cadherin-23 [Hyalella azteca]|uniref:Cadherin-23 n=1 Tax=Hyalella azteca TaxID=294128 RepID=A0A8B7NS96_HYAAZ|nr:cadherin-23 [Hyalella azteca]
MSSSGQRALLSSLILILAGILVLPVAALECPKILDQNPDCLQNGKVGTNPENCNIVVNVYEDCEEGSSLFIVEGSSVSFGTSNCKGAVDIDDNNAVVLNNALDAELGSIPPSCLQKIIYTINGTEFSALLQTVDVDEFPPMLTNQAPALTIYTDENNQPDYFLLAINVSDPDYGETSTLSGVLLDTFDDRFALRRHDGCEASSCEVATFDLVAAKSLDYEDGVFYEIEATFTSSDSRGSHNTTQITVLLFINDLPDSPPFWLKIVPTVSVQESDEVGKEVFSVLARDRDIGIDNDINYDITNGNDGGYFAIDKAKGVVTTAKAIDREVLNATFFNLEVMAYEVLANGSMAPDPNNVTQVTNVQVTDVNDCVPEFGAAAMNVTMSELTALAGGGSFVIGYITVEDLDEDQAGEYALTSSQPQHLAFSPRSGSGETNFTVTALYVPDDNIYDYESRPDNDYDIIIEINATEVADPSHVSSTTLIITLIFYPQINSNVASDPSHVSSPTLIITLIFFPQINATEVADPSHVSSITLIITLEDVNDNYPVFKYLQYPASIYENLANELPVINVLATDNDKSDEYGTLSLRYFMFNCDSYFTINDVTGTITVTGQQNLDYEQRDTIECNLEARDLEGGTGYLKGTSTLVVELVDVDDTPPDIAVMSTSYEVLENETVGSVLVSVAATDKDTNASVNFYIIYEDNNRPGVEDWFIIEDRPCEPEEGDFCADVKTNAELDRETQDKVAIKIIAVDNNTDMNAATDSVDVTITLLDVNDKTPVFCDTCAQDDSVYENSPSGSLIARIYATDEDLDDILIYDCSSCDTVVLDNSTGALTVGVNSIDRETQAYINVTITVTDAAGHSAVMEVSITVKDRNDESPVLDEALCGKTYDNVFENAANGTHVVTMTATDKDEGAHAKISYILTKIAGGTGPLSPFAIDADTGEIVVKVGNGITLDREETATWVLQVKAIDSCEFNEPSCTERTNACNITISVQDENDETPYLPAPLTLTANEALTASTYGGGDCLPCLDDLDWVEVSYTDNDEDKPNNQAEIVINYDNSVIYPSNATGQLENFIMKAASKPRTFNLCLKSDMVGNLSRTEALAYNLSLIATDYGEPPLVTYSWIYVNLKPVSEFEPAFCTNITECHGETYILEETTDAGKFRVATDEDNLYAVDDIIYYYIVGQEFANFEIPDPEEPFVKPLKPLDRDYPGPGEYLVLIQATNSKNPPLSQGTDINPTTTAMLQLKIVLIDKNDNAPIFDSEVIYGSVLQTGSVDQVAAYLLATDKDLNETLIYSRIGDINWDPVQYDDSVFQVLDDSVTGTVWLRQSPSNLKGYCTFSVQVTDHLGDEHKDTALVQIFIVTTDDEVSFYFKNDIETLISVEDDVSHACVGSPKLVIRSTFGYLAFITGGGDNTTRDSVVAAHFVDNATAPLRAADSAPGNIVPPNVIESLASSAVTSSQLQSSLRMLGLDLYQVGESPISNRDELEAQLLTYQITLAVVAMVLGSLVFLLTTAYCVRTRKLERRVKVLTTNTFGSHSSDLNRAGLAAVPNSNLFKGEGTNPMFNISLQEFNKQETGSINSGDSVLVGVEDNPEFRDYKAGQKQDNSSRMDAPAYVGADGVASNNPLFAVLDQPSATAPSDQGSDGGSYVAGDLGTPNSNFIFQ